MNVDPSAHLQVGDLLPPLSLPSAPSGTRHDLRAYSRDALILLLLPPACSRWSGYLATLARAAGEIEQWYARVRVVVAGGGKLAAQLKAELNAELVVLADADGETARHVGIGAGDAALLIADRYGQIYEVFRAQRAEELPGAAEIEEWAKFLATQCPECGVIDEPGRGEWALS